MAAPTPFRSVGDLVDALSGLGGSPSDDVLGALPHLLQTADLLDASGDPELIVAGLVHDLASALDSRCGDHAAVGSDLVGPLLGGRVARLVAGHTDAKRYLVTVDPSYAGRLSPNSAFTLVGQGGTMTPDELVAFRHGSDLAALVALRRADDGAKIRGRAVPEIAAWRPLLDSVAARAATRTDTPHLHSR